MVVLKKKIYQSLEFYHIVFFATVFLSILKREGECFPMFVPWPYCVSARTFLGVPDRFCTVL